MKNPKLIILIPGLWVTINLVFIAAAYAVFGRVGAGAGVILGTVLWAYLLYWVSKNRVIFSFALLAFILCHVAHCVQ
jgi:hypothetical protein